LVAPIVQESLDAADAKLKDIPARVEELVAPHRPDPSDKPMAKAREVVKQMKECANETSGSGIVTELRYVGLSNVSVEQLYPTLVEQLKEVQSPKYAEVKAALLQEGQDWFAQVLPKWIQQAVDDNISNYIEKYIKILEDFVKETGKYQSALDAARKAIKAGEVSYCFHTVIDLCFRKNLRSNVKQQQRLLYLHKEYSVEVMTKESKSSLQLFSS
jgi:hypothetical protein